MPHLLTADDLDRFFRAVQRGGHVQHEIMLKLLFFTAMRVGELVKLEVGDVDWTNCKIFVDQGKGSKDRYLLFPRAFALVLRAHIAAHPKNRFLFETQRCAGYTVRRVQQIVQRYREQAGLSEAVHPHLFRHQMLTFLTGQKLSDAQIQLLSGHASKKSLEVYQHLSLEAVEGAYQGAVKLLGV
ncbi:MAG: tyrosine-type recombinase/integrase [Pleurocapsa sp. SU_196_0]|nr:tyrosine-type recombinase/integrase [Pleurocapsa sp. SU_196_0]